MLQRRWTAEFQLEKIEKYMIKGLTVNPILFYFELDFF